MAKEETADQMAARTFWITEEGVPALYVTGNEPELKRWITWPHYAIIACDVVLIFFAVGTWYHVKQQSPPTTEHVRIVAQQWAWTFVHPGPDGEFDTADDIKTADELHVVVNKAYHFRLESRDVLHSFSVPVFRLKQDAIPGRTSRAGSSPPSPGRTTSSAPRCAASATASWAPASSSRPRSSTPPGWRRCPRSPAPTEPTSATGEQHVGSCERSRPWARRAR
jgi:hypothetical protein